MTVDRALVVPWAGLAGPFAWAVQTELGLALSGRTCGYKTNVILMLAAACMIAALSGAWISWRAGRTPRLIEGTQGNPRRFIAGISAALGLLFAIVILMQGIASLFLSGCVR